MSVCLFTEPWLKKAIAPKRGSIEKLPDETNN